MALTFAKGSGVNDELWKTIDLPLRSVLKDTDLEKNKDDELVNALFNVETSDKFGEKASGLTEFGDFDIVDEGETGVADTIQQGWSKLIEHKQFIKSFSCTAEMNEDGDISVMKEKAANFVRSYKRTRARYASLALTSEGASFTGFGKTLDRTTGDAKALFAVDHKGKLANVATQSNVFTNAIGTDTVMLNKLANIGRNFKNDSGQVIGYTFDTIVVPSNCPALEDLVKKIIGSDGEVGTDKNDINTQRGKWKLVVDHLWEAADGTAPYIGSIAGIYDEEAEAYLYKEIYVGRVAPGEGSL